MSRRRPWWERTPVGEAVRERARLVGADQATRILTRTGIGHQPTQAQLLARIREGIGDLLPLEDRLALDVHLVVCAHRPAHAKDPSVLAHRYLLTAASQIAVAEAALIVQAALTQPRRLGPPRTRGSLEATLGAPRLRPRGEVDR